MPIQSLTALVLLCTMTCAVCEAEDVDGPATILIEGRVWTSDARRPAAEAIAVRGEKMVAVGSRDEVQKYRGDKTQVIDAGDGLVVLRRQLICPTT